MNRRMLTLALVALLACSIAAGVAPAAAQDDRTCEPENKLTYDEFRTDDGTIAEFNDGGTATVEKQNTEASIDADEAFVRLSLANGNTYCVEYTIQIGDSVVTPATLGSVSASDSDVNADWRAVHDFDADETYTEVTVTVPATQNATFAPSQLRVKSLSWTSNIESSGMLNDLRDTLGFGGAPLEERTHTLSGNTSEQITIPLTHPENADERIEDWHATYTVDGEETERILSEDSGNAVFYRSVDDGEAIQLVYNEPASVEFVAEPTIRERAGFEIQSYLSSLSEALDLPLPDSVPVLEVMG